MLAVKVIQPFKRRGVIVTPGTIIADVPDSFLPKLAGLVELLPRCRQVLHWQPEANIWLQDGELRITGVISDLAAEIVKLTGDNLALQRRLLTEYCQAYSPTHIWALVERWEERAAIMEYDSGMARDDAEAEAARQYNLLAFLPELRSGTLH